MDEKEIECELWCPSCRLFYAKIWRIQTREGVWEHRREPAVVPTRCTICDMVIERRT